MIGPDPKVIEKARGEYASGNRALWVLAALAFAEEQTRAEVEGMRKVVEAAIEWKETVRGCPYNHLIEPAKKLYDAVETYKALARLNDRDGKGEE